MPRQYGTLGAPQYTSAPTIGPAGNLYYNTTLGRLFVSDGVTWDGVDTYNTTEGWMTASYIAYVGANNIFMFADSNVMVASIPKGTRIRATVASVDYYGVVANAVNGAPGIAANPLTTVAYNGTTDIFTKAAHGLAVGDSVMFVTGTPPAPFAANIPFWVIAANFTTGQFQLSASPGGAAINLNAVNSNCDIYTGTRVELAPNADVAYVRGWNVVLLQYSYAMSPPGYPGWWNYTTGQPINPLTFTGYSAIPTGLVYQFRIDGNMATYNFRETTNGTSNATTTTMTLPVAASATPASIIWTGQSAVIDNGTQMSNPGGLQINAAGTVVNAWKDYGNFVPWTGTGGKRVVRGQIVYGI